MFGGEAKLSLSSEIFKKRKLFERITDNCDVTEGFCRMKERSRSHESILDSKDRDQTSSWQRFDDVTEDDFIGISVSEQSKTDVELLVNGMKFDWTLNEPYSPSYDDVFDDGSSYASDDSASTDSNEPVRRYTFCKVVGSSQCRDRIENILTCCCRGAFLSSSVDSLRISFWRWPLTN